MAQGTNLTELVHNDWPGLSVTTIQPPKPLKLCVDWTGEPISTAVMIKKVAELKENSPNLYREFLNESAKAVSTILTSFKLADCSGAISGLRDNRHALKKLGGKCRLFN